MRERELSDQMAELVAAVERRVEERLRAWEADLERAQNALQGAVSTSSSGCDSASRRWSPASRPSPTSSTSTLDQQRAASVPAPRGPGGERERDALAQALDELQAQADDRRRRSTSMTERLRQHEHAVHEQVDRAESEARARIDIAFSELERRQVEHLERATEREIDARSEAGRARVREPDASDPRGGRGPSPRGARPDLRGVPAPRGRPDRGPVPAGDERRVAAPRRPHRRARPALRACALAVRELNLSERQQGTHGDRECHAHGRDDRSTALDENEPAKVESWRLHILLEAGYPVHLAERLAVSEVDLHDAVELVRRGCDPMTAAEILF